MIDPLRLLLVEGSVNDAELVLRELRRMQREIEFERVEDADAMRSALLRKSWDAVLSDWSMPRFSASAALALIKELGLDLPLIIVSGTIGEETAVEAMRAGAKDFVLKDKPARLIPVLERELRERKERAAHRGSEALRAAIMETAPDAIVGMDHAGRVTDFSPAAEKLFGYSRAEVLGQMLAELIVPPSSREAYRLGLERYVVTGVGPVLGKRIELSAMRRDGSEFPAEVAITAVAASSPPTFLGFIRDISESRRAEIGRQRAEDALRRSEEQLRHAQKMEAVGRLAGGVAHDFNNVLSVIISYCQLLLADLGRADPMRGDIEQIAKAGKRAAELTRQLLMFSRQQVLEPKVLDIRELLSDMETMLRRLVGEDVDLILVHSASRAKIRVDLGSLEQVIMNLVVNARDAMPTGGKLTLETSTVMLDEEYARDHLGAKPGRHVMFAVSDSGTGMDPATLSRIFEPFYTTKEHGKGTGLGLSMVFGIVQQSEGHLWVYSEPGRGTTFKVYLPLVDAPVEGLRSLEPPATLRGTETILLVEDDEHVRTVACNILKRHGYRVVEARNAGEALLFCEKHAGTIELLLSDVVMPQMSGPELAKRLVVVRPAMKVLCMSGYTDDAAVRHGVIEAEISYLQKPITVETLTRRVREVLDGPGND